MGLFDAAKESAAGGVMKGLLDQLENSEAVKKGIAMASDALNTLKRTANRFDERFNALDATVSKIAGDTTAIRFILEHPSDVNPAAEHDLTKVLTAEPKPCSVQGCTDRTIHDHGEGPVFYDAARHVPQQLVAEVPHESEPIHNEV